MINAIQIWMRCNQMGVNKSLTEIQNALNSIDTASIIEAEKSRFRIEIWDKKSPINGVPAETILQRDDIPKDGEVYLIYIDGNLVYFQPHDPFQAGTVPLTAENVLTVANKHVQQLAEQFAEEKIFMAVLEKLLA